MFTTNSDGVLCTIGKIYQSYQPNDFEAETGICIWVKSDLGENVPLTPKVYNKYFMTIEQMRDNKINQILK